MDSKLFPCDYDLNFKNKKNNEELEFQENLEKAKMLSLITAKEEQQKILQYTKKKKDELFTGSFLSNISSFPIIENVNMNIPTLKPPPKTYKQSQNTEINRSKIQPSSTSCSHYDSSPKELIKFSSSVNSNQDSHDGYNVDIKQFDPFFQDVNSNQSTTLKNRICCSTSSVTSNNFSSGFVNFSTFTQFSPSSVNLNTFPKMNCISISSLSSTLQNSTPPIPPPRLPRKKTLASNQPFQRDEFFKHHVSTPLKIVNLTNSQNHKNSENSLFSDKNLSYLSESKSPVIDFSPNNESKKILAQSEKFIDQNLKEEKEDLITFFDTTQNKSESNYMSLADFDPLFQMEKPSSFSCSQIKHTKLLVPSNPLRNQQENFYHDKPLPPIPQSFPSNFSSLKYGSIHESFPRSALLTNIEKKLDLDEDPFDPFALCSLMQQKQKHQPEIKKDILRKNVFSHDNDEYLEELPETADEEIQAFLEMVVRIKLKHSIEDSVANSGVVVSVQGTSPIYIDMTVKLILYGDMFEEPFAFVSDVNSTVEHVISFALLSVYDDKNFSPEDYLLKVFGSSEYFLNNSLLSSYTYVQQCLKLSIDIKLILQHVHQILRPFQKTEADVNHPVYVPKVLSNDETSSHLNIKELNILLEIFYKEIRKLKNEQSDFMCKGVIQSVKAICTLLNCIETVEVAESLKKLENLFKNENILLKKRVVCFYDENQISFPKKNNQIESLRKILKDLIQAVKELISMFSINFHKEFRFNSILEKSRKTKDIKDLTENFKVHLASVHRVPEKWKNLQTEFCVNCKLLFGDKQLGKDVISSIVTSKQFSSSTIAWNEWLTFDEIRICDLPREARLLLTLVGLRMHSNSTNEGQTQVRRSLCWVIIQLFNHKYELVEGSQLLGMWIGGCSFASATNSTNTSSNNSVLLQINMRKFDHIRIFPKISEVSCEKHEFNELHPDDKEDLLNIMNKDSLDKLYNEEKEFLWQKKNYLHEHHVVLPKILQSISSWAWYLLPEVYMLLKVWSPMEPFDCLQLLLPRFPDTVIRNFAVERLSELSPDAFCILLPQLVQALRFECYHTSALACLILEKCSSNVRIAHQVYWLLKDAADDIYNKKRYQLMFGALLSVVGEGMREEFGKQEEFVQLLSSIADKVKSSKDKEAVLRKELENMWIFLNNQTVRLPINPALEVAGLDLRSCSYFTSFTVPLKLAFKNVDPRADDIYVMFKVGDDLRQDMLTIQLIKFMDNLWLQEGLDFKMITFRIQPTSFQRGFVELINDSETLGKIQKKEHGVTGSFKDTPISKWLQMYNSSELSYQMAVDNFMRSCAGYCLATYILGICDRHNDNIMIKHSGHIFHIDFAKFLGDSQMLGAINRDRTPFVLTSDMAYVINGGDKPTEKFQQFLDLCCKGLNIIRKNSNIFINLLSLMVSSGIPRVNENAPKFLKNTLMPERSDSEATAEFTRMVNASLKSISTQLNFFLHNLAQLKFSPHDEGHTLSFIPKTYSILTDGKIVNLQLTGMQKRYNPDKFYMYIIQVERENQKLPFFVLRRFSQFQELHRKLVQTFPLISWPSLSGKFVLGRSHVKVVAEARKLELKVFLSHILSMKPEVADHNLIYTFFHPMLVDEQENDTSLMKLKGIQTSSQIIPSGVNKYLKHVEGSIKLNLFFNNHGFTVMVMHVKNLTKLSNGELPSPYVKIYLLPDPAKTTKRKTKIVKNTCHPTYNEMLIYRCALMELKNKILKVTVLSYDGLKENEFMGGNIIRLSELNLQLENPSWYKLLNLQEMESNLF